jgi:predicted neutral ceramidase superfamily lipid hydrolase
MPRPYDMPNNISGVNTVLEYSNNVINGWLTVLFCLAAVVAIFIICKTKFMKTSDSLLMANFLTFILSSFLWGAGLLLGKFVILFLTLTIISGLYSIFDS